MSERGWPDNYILMNRVPIAVDWKTWAVWFDKIENRRVARTEINESCYVSTVFLGLDHNFSGKGEPLLFETMIFGGPLDQDTYRYRTWADAERGHEAAVVEARKAIAQVDAIKKAAHTTD
jgi:hypothetical protein